MEQNLSYLCIANLNMLMVLFNSWMRVAQKRVIVMKCDGETVERPTPKNRVSKSISSRVVFAKKEKEWSEFNSQTIPELTT